MQVRGYADAKASPTEVSSILEQRIRGVQEEAGLAETGRVLSIGYVVWSSATTAPARLCWPQQTIEAHLPMAIGRCRSKNMD